MTSFSLGYWLDFGSKCISNKNLSVSLTTTTTTTNHNNNIDVQQQKHYQHQSMLDESSATSFPSVGGGSRLNDHSSSSSSNNPYYHHLNHQYNRHPLQTVGILFNGSANDEGGEGNVNVRLMDNNHPLQQQQQMATMWQVGCLLGGHMVLDPENPIN